MKKLPFTCGKFQVKLHTINTVLRVFGCVLVVSFDEDEQQTKLWLERTKSYKRRVHVR